MMLHSQTGREATSPNVQRIVHGDEGVAKIRAFIGREFDVPMDYTEVEKRLGASDATKKPRKEADMAKTDVAVAEEPKVPATMGDQLPDYLKGGSYKNEDNFDSSDIVIPRIKLLQGLSTEVTETYPGIAKIGEFWHTGLDISLGSRIDFVIADRRKKYLLQAPIADGQGILARADDAKTWDRLGKWSIKIKNVKAPVLWEIHDLDVEKSGLANWGTSIPDDEDSPPAATLFYDYLVFLPDRLDLGPAVISLARSQVRKAKKGLNDKIKLHSDSGRPMQALVFSATSVDDAADGQDFKNWQFVSSGFLQDKAMFDMVCEYRGALARFKIADEGAVDEAAPTDDGSGKY